jgi:hypothetical protein
MRSSDETNVFRLFALFAGTPRELRRRRGGSFQRATIREQKKEWFYVVIQKYRWYS